LEGGHFPCLPQAILEVLPFGVAGMENDLLLKREIASCFPNFGKISLNSSLLAPQVGVSLKKRRLLMPRRGVRSPSFIFFSSDAEQALRRSVQQKKTLIMKQFKKNSEFEQVLIRRYMIIGERRISNYWWAFIISLGSFGFLLTGILSYLASNSPQNSVLNNETIPFFPQGLLMSFYGSLGLLLSLYWWFLIFWNIGSGFNEFNKKDGLIRIFRWGYPGKNRKIDLSYTLNDVEAIKVELKQGLDPQRTIYLKLKGSREIPLTGIGQPLVLKDIEKQASELANFLQVSLEGL
jgi:hypothetical protein